MEEPTTLKTLIIDDEKDARDAMEVLLQKFVTGVEVIGQAVGVKDGIEKIKELNPDLVFLDINMEDGTGFDLLDQLDQFDFSLVFVTAFNQYAIKAFKYAAFDYLLKPVDLQELRKCVDRLSSTRILPSSDRINQLKTAKQKGKISKLTLPNLGGFDVVYISDIIRCEGQKNYTTFHMKDGNKIVVSQTLKEYEMMLKDYGFLRVFQSHVINLNCIQKYIKGRGGMVVMEDESNIPVSREKKDELLARLREI